MIKGGNGMEHAGYKKQVNDPSKVFKGAEKKPLRYSQDSFIKDLIGKKIRISLTTKEVFEGNLKQLGMYDVLLEIKTTEKINIAGNEMLRDSTKERIFMKSAIIWIEVIQ
ncbi:MAG: hypothetical protein M1592_03110 [Candidatus Thermoplasmatota archaeon]|nr:hypothetical protein [Candidatus Thermoplasmatota archaeon]